MRTIIVPEDIQLKNVVTGEPVNAFKSFKQFAIDCWLNDPRFASTPQHVVRLAKILPKFASVKPGDIIQLEDNDWERLKEIVSGPQQHNTAPLVMVQLIAFTEAVLSATDDG